MCINIFVYLPRYVWEEENGEKGKENESKKKKIKRIKKRKKVELEDVPTVRAHETGERDCWSCIFFFQYGGQKHI